MEFQDTIFALSSGGLPAGVAVVRISGRSVAAIIQNLAGDIPAPRRAVLREFRDGGRLLDKGLLLYFPAPHSFTGEDCAELHLHGGKAVVAVILDVLSRFPGARQATAGEFTRRAFVLGKIDLVSAEALSDVIAAETEAQRRFALSGASAAAELYADWRQRLIHGLAMIEAELDFADEGDVPGSVADRVWSGLSELHVKIGRHLDGFRQGEIIRNGFKVVILGAPNVGKSSLLNAIARRDVALVSDEPGTTRDLIEISLDLGGQKVLLTDTAGIRDGAGRVEAMGIERALSRAQEADLVLELFGPGEPVLPMVPGSLTIRTKADLGQMTGHDILSISAVTGDGLSELLHALEKRAREASYSALEVLPARQRHVDALRGAASHIGMALELPDGRLELKAEELRLAVRAFGHIAGEVDAEDILDEVFSRFCIGK